MMNAVHINRIPEVYIAVKLRNVTPKDEGAFGIGFDRDDGSVIRLKMSSLDIEMLFQLTHSHSCRSSGIPGLDVSSMI